MNAATETVKRHKLTQEDCDIARFFTRRGMKIKEIAKILKVDPSTVGKIQKADFRLETYLEQRKEMNRKTKERKAAAEAGRRRLNKLLDPVADKERDKKVLDQLTREELAAGRYPTLPPDESWKMVPDAPAEVPGQGILEEVKLKDGATPPKPFKRFSTCQPIATWLMGEEPKYMPPAEEVPGQMKMNLEPEKDPTPAVQDDTKSMMKFQAAMVDKLVKGMTEAIVAMIDKLTVLDEIRDALKGGGSHE